MQIERWVPARFKNHYKRLRSAIKNRKFGSSNLEIFQTVYRNRHWGSTPESDIYSGPGTYDPATRAYVDYVLSFIEQRGITTIAEIGCGDFSIGAQYADKVDSYLGVDASAAVIGRNREKYGSARITFLHADAGEIDLPPSDLCLVRQVFQHLDNDSIARILRRITVHRYVLVTEHLPNPDHLDRPNLNKRAGPDTRLIFDSGVFVELPPFNLKGETVLALPVAACQAHAGEVMRTILITNR